MFEGRTMTKWSAPNQPPKLLMRSLLAASSIPIKFGSRQGLSSRAPYAVCRLENYVGRFEYMQTQRILAYEINFLCLFVVKQILSARWSIFPAFICDATRQICRQQEQSISQMEQKWRIAGIFHGIAAALSLHIFWANYVCSRTFFVFTFPSNGFSTSGKFCTGKMWASKVANLICSFACQPPK